MLSPARLTQLLVEFIFVLLGALVVFLGLTGRIFFDRRSTSWLGVSLALIVWGILAMVRSGDWRTRWEKWNRGASLALLGVIMLVTSRVPFLWVAYLLSAAGFVLIVRGLISVFLILRQSSTYTSRT
jgi:hypothetical protein